MNIQFKTRRVIFILLMTAAMLVLINSSKTAAQSPYWLSEGIQQIKGPNNITEIPAWRAQIEFWRKVEKTKLAYTDSFYNGKDVQWVEKIVLSRPR